VVAAYLLGSPNFLEFVDVSLLVSQDGLTLVSSNGSLVSVALQWINATVESQFEADLISSLLTPDMKSSFLSSNSSFNTTDVVVSVVATGLRLPFIQEIFSTSLLRICLGLFGLCICRKSKVFTKTR
jgi:hypothetical protein